MINRRNLPLNSLRAFEASARHLSFSKGAEELCVTHSAISQQVRLLEDQLETKLFSRTNRGVQLTEAGQTLLPLLAEFFDRITATLDGLVSEPLESRIRLTTTPSLASRWLMPRLSLWRRDHPELSIHLLPTLPFLDLAMGEAEIGIRCGLPPWKGLDANLVMPIHMAPLCSPALLADKTQDLTARDLLAFTLLHADVAGHELGEEWQVWLAAAGVDSMAKAPGLSFHDPNLALQAALDGLGIAMGYLELAEPDIASGRLVCPVPLAVRHRFSYHLAYPAAKSSHSEIQDFRSWVLAEGQKTTDLVQKRIGTHFATRFWQEA
jgi:LysR family glycine cleavage system transcriptional activator